MTAVSGKKVEGVLEEINPTTIVVAKKMIYLPPEKREAYKSLGFKLTDELRVVYDMKGNYINAELLKPGELKEIEKNKFVPHKVVETEADKAKKLHIQQPKTAEGATPAGDRSNEKVHIQEQKAAPAQGVPTTDEKKEIHMQTETVAPQSSAAPATQYTSRTWIPEQEREDRIVIQSVLSRAVDIINNHYMYFPSSLNKSDFNESLDARINHIENTADRLFEYVTNKVEKEKSRVRK